MEKADKLIYKKEEKIRPHLLLGYEGSVASKKALNYLKEVFEGVELDLTLVKIIPYPESLMNYETDVLKHLKKEIYIEKEAKRILEDAEKGLKVVKEELESKLRGKVFIRVFFKYRDIAETLVQLCREGYFDGVVVGRRGLTKIATYILGGVTHKLIGFANLPVWIIRGTSWNKKFLIAIDFGETGIKVVDYVTFILNFHPWAEITFFHHFYPFAGLKNFEGTLEELLVEIKGSQEYRNFFEKIKMVCIENGFPLNRVKFRLKRGFLGPAGEIIRTAKKGDYSTVVVGRRGRGGMSEFILGSVSQKVLGYFEDRAVWIIS